MLTVEVGGLGWNMSFKGIQSKNRIHLKDKFKRLKMLKTLVAIYSVMFNLILSHL